MRCAIFGAGGGIGSAMVRLLHGRDDVSVVHAGSRSGEGEQDGRLRRFSYDLTEEATIERAVAQMSVQGPLDMVIVATGLLQDLPDVSPEKAWSAIDPDAMARVFAVNTIGPAIIAKHVMPVLGKEGARFAALSARVGSIGDNRLGGWHSYRASKAALNMLVRNFAIELKRRNRSALAVALHPGTVDTALSKPFQGNVPEHKLFDAGRAAEQLLDVLQGLRPEDSGGFFAWDGQPIEW